MTIAKMFEQSAVLALLGMLVVFSFLLLLVLCVTLSGKIIRALGLDKEAESAPAASAPVVSEGAAVAAISAAVKEYRKE